MKVVVGASSFADASEVPLQRLREAGIVVQKNPYGRRLTKEETIDFLQGADAILAGLEPLDEEVFVKTPMLKAIARIGIGMDNVDQTAATKYGIKVSNTPQGPTNAVAEMTLTALLNIIHNVIPANADVHNGVWKKRLGQSISDLKILIIGYGHIGRATANLLEVLGATILIYDKYNKEASNVTLEEGLKQADVISLHASGKEEILGAKEIALMPEGTVILNSARGALVNEDALYEALQSKKIRAFWGDALWQEPYQGKLCQCENAILTPHICTYTTTCREAMEMQAVENLLRDLGK